MKFTNTSFAKPTATCLLALATAACLAQSIPTPTPTPPATVPLNRGIILLDPAHGGLDSGSRINDSLVEKDVTLNLAFKLRSLLAARGFSITMTRDSDTPATPTPLTLDDRAALANHAHPVACLLLHATAAGSGVHLYSSELDPTPGEPTPNPWLTAQAPWVTQSQRLQKQLGLAFTRAGIPLVLSRASVRPLDSLTCPALVLELAPNGSDPASLNDADYQQHVAEAIATALVFWKNQAQPPTRILPEGVTAAPLTPPPPAKGVQP